MNSFDEDPSVCNGFIEVAVTIDRPAKEVWKQLVDLPSWISSHQISQLSGSADTVGSITRVTPKGIEELGLPPAHYHYCKVIKVVPERQYLLKTFSEKNGSYGWRMIGFDDMRLEAVGEKTKFTFSLFLEIKVQDGTLDAKAMEDGARERMLKNMTYLKDMLERRPKN